MKGLHQATRRLVVSLGLAFAVSAAATDADASAGYDCTIKDQVVELDVGFSGDRAGDHALTVNRPSLLKVRLPKASRALEIPVLSEHVTQVWIEGDQLNFKLSWSIPTELTLVVSTRRKQGVEPSDYRGSYTLRYCAADGNGQSCSVKPLRGSGTCAGE